MQVSGVETSQPFGREDKSAKASESPGNGFAALLNNVIGSNGSLLRLESGTGLAQQIVPDAPPPKREIVETRPQRDDETTSEIEAADSEPAPKPDESKDDKVEAAGEEKPQVLPGNNTAIVNDDGNADQVAVAAAQTTNESLGDNSEPVKANTLVIETDSGETADGGTVGEAQSVLAAVATNQATAKTQSATTNTTALQNAATAAAQPVEQPNATPAAVPATPEKKPQNDTPKLTAQVSESPQELVSRPTNTLAASATLASQTEKQRAAATAGTGEANQPSENSGNLLLNSAPKKAQNTGTHLRGSAQNTSAPPNAGNEATGNTNGQAASFQATLASAQSPLTTAIRSAFAPGARAPEMLPLNTVGGSATTSPATNAVLRPPPSAPAPRVPPQALTQQIAVQIQKSIAQGQDQIKIQLKPAELGRVEIKLDVAQDGRVAATVIVDRPETLELLQRDARGLQQALQDGGLKSDGGNLNFNLRDGSASGGEQSTAGNGTQDAASEDNQSDVLTANDDAGQPHHASDSIVDVKV